MAAASGRLIRVKLLLSDDADSVTTERRENHEDAVGRKCRAYGASMAPSSKWLDPSLNPPSRKEILVHSARDTSRCLS